MRIVVIDNSGFQPKLAGVFRVSSDKDITDMMAEIGSHGETWHNDEECRDPFGDYLLDQGFEEDSEEVTLEFILE